MTSVPKPLKFLRPHFERLIALQEAMMPSEERKFLCDILSVIAMSTGDPKKRLTLYYRLRGSIEPLESWGHDYVRHLAAEISLEFEGCVEADKSYDDLIELSMEMVPLFMKHNAEADACDLLLELLSLDKIVDYVDEETYHRVCLYLESMSVYVPYPENMEIMQVIYSIYRKLQKWSEAMFTAIRMNHKEYIKDIFESCSDAVMKRQLAYMVARERIVLPIETDAAIEEILSNTKLSKHFLELAKELEILEPKTPEDIYKTHLENVKFPGPPIGASKSNMANTLVNAFVNVGFGRDKLLLDESVGWLYKNKDVGTMCAAASVGMLFQWDLDAMTQIDKYIYSDDDFVKAGGLMAVGIMNCGVRSEYDPVLYLLSEYTESKSSTLLTGTIVGLGLAYINTSKQEVIDLLETILSNPTGTSEIHSLAALSLGFVCLGTSNGEVTSAILQAMMESEERTLKEPYMRFMALGLALIYLERHQDYDVILESLKVVGAPLGRQASVLVELCAHVGKLVKE
jgi:26S proteasome regulatory subunit N1